MCNTVVFIATNIRFCVAQIQKIKSQKNYGKDKEKKVAKKPAQKSIKEKRKDKKEKKAAKA